MKKLLALLLCLCLMISLAACGGSGGAASSAAEPEAAEAEEEPEEKEEEPAEEPEEEAEETAEEPADDGEKENVHLEVHIVRADWADGWDVMEEKFEEEYPWIDVEAVGIGNLQDFIQQRLAAKDLPAVLQVDPDDLNHTLVDAGLLEDVRKYKAAENVPQAYLDQFTYNGVCYGITQGAAFPVMYYNMGILEEAGWDDIPQNWDELIQCCKDIEEKTDTEAIAVSGAFTTTVYMPMELIIANYVAPELGEGQYEAMMKAGEFDFTAYPVIEEKLNELLPHFMEGSGSLEHDGSITVLADGDCAMCIAGNWLSAPACEAIAEYNGGDTSKAKASLPPFNPEGAPVAISTSPETAFGVSIDPERSEAEQEAVDIFYEWVFEPENFKIIQNARGTVPVLTNMPDEYIVLPDAMIPVVGEMQAAPSVLMGFNLMSTEFNEIEATHLSGMLSGTVDVHEGLAEMSKALKENARGDS